MDGPLDLSSRDRAQRLLNKNVELQNQRRRTAQARIPSDPSIWTQMRENYEAIILEDHEFAEKHEIECALWQLHYRRINELRAHCDAASLSNSASSQSGKESTRPDPIVKVRSQIKCFLFEATGFYHDLMLKIRAKYGFSLPDNQMVICKDEVKSADMKKCLISCHNCLIYLGDLSRYKGLYGDGDSKAGDLAAASSYYMQASSQWSPGGNPHHQLAIMASYAGDELVTIYRYFRSLAVGNPFSTARENLILAFEVNRQNFTQLAADAKASSIKGSPARTNGKRRGKGGAMRPAKDGKWEANRFKDIASTTAEIFKAFSIRFIRLNGVLFTRISVETFEDVLSMVSVDLIELLSSGPEEKYNFSSVAEDNKIVIVRLIASLIFTVHNVNRVTENQSYSEILQHSVLLEHALTAAFEIVGLILERSVQLNDVCSSFLLPSVLVFLEWLACHPEIASGSEVKEKQAAARSLFWNSCISFLNKLISSDFAKEKQAAADESCFFSMSKYDECKTTNRLALWEDFELRGFLPLAPAHQILDFSWKQSVGSDDNSKEKKTRVQRILSAGKALANIVRIGQEGIYFDPKSNEFAIGIEPQIYCGDAHHSSLEVPDANALQQVHEKGKIIKSLQPKVEGEEEDEVIVFRPSVNKHADLTVPKATSYEVLGHGVHAANTNLGSGLGAQPYSVNSSCSTNGFDTNARLSPPSIKNIMLQQLQSVPTSTSQWPVQQQTMFANGLSSLNLMENARATKPGLSQHLSVLQSAGPSLSPLQYVSASGNEWSVRVPSKIDSIMSSGAVTDIMAMNPSIALPANIRKNPVSRPVRHLGPPPGFGPVPPKVSDESFSGIILKNENLQRDNYSWLDEYHFPSAAKDTGFDNLINHSAQSHHPAIKSSMAGTMAFPFPGKQVPVIQGNVESKWNWQEFNFPDHFKLYQEQLEQQQVPKINHQPTPVTGQKQGHALWESRFFV